LPTKTKKPLGRSKCHPLKQ